MSIAVAAISRQGLRARAQYGGKGARSHPHSPSVPNGIQLYDGMGDPKQYVHSYYPLATYYVSATATGGGSGTRADPLTLGEAVAAAVPGDEFLLMAGTYGTTGAELHPESINPPTADNAFPGTGWTLPTGWSISSGILTKTAGVANDAEFDFPVAVEGTSYHFVLNCLTYTAGLFTVVIAGTAGANQSNTGEKTGTIVAGSESPAKLKVRALGTETAATFGYLSIKEGPTLTPTVSGTQDNPIIWRAEPDALGLSTNQVRFLGGIDASSVSWNWYWGIELTSGTLNPGLELYQGRGITTPTGAANPGTRVINCIIHDQAGNAIGLWGQPADSPKYESIYGNILYRQGAIDANPHHCYAQHAIDSGGRKYVVNNYWGTVTQTGVAPGSSFGFHGFSTNGEISGFYLKQNVKITPASILLSDQSGGPHSNVLDGNYLYGGGVEAWSGGGSPPDPGQCMFVGNHIVTQWVELAGHANGPDSIFDHNLAPNGRIEANQFYSHRTGTQTGERVKRAPNVIWGNSLVDLFAQEPAVYDLILAGYNGDSEITLQFADLMETWDRIGNNAQKVWGPSEDTHLFHTKITHGPAYITTNLIVDGDFPDNTNWTEGGNWLIGSGTASHTTGVQSDLTQSITGKDPPHPDDNLHVNAIYEVLFTISGATAGTVTPVVAGRVGAAESGNGAKSQDVIGSNGASTVIFRASSDFDGSIDDASLRHKGPFTRKFERGTGVNDPIRMLDISPDKAIAEYFPGAANFGEGDTRDDSKAYDTGAAGLASESFAVPNEYEPGRGRLILYNHNKLAEMTVDVSSILEPGDSFELRDPEDFFGTPYITGSLRSGTTITVPTVPDSEASQLGPRPPYDSPEAYYRVYEVVKTGDYRDSQWWDCNYVPLRTRYISASASGSGNGDILDPYTIAQAEAAAQAGDEFIFLPGTYGAISQYTLSPTINGTLANPIVWRAQPDVFGQSSQNINILGGIDCGTTARWNWIWGLHISGDNTAASWGGYGVNIHANDTNSSGVRVINCVFENSNQIGVGYWGGDGSSGNNIDTVVYGCLFYNFGASGGSDMHNIYTQNNWNDTKKHKYIMNCYFERNFIDSNPFAIHGFGTQEYVSGYYVKDCIFWRSSAIMGSDTHPSHHNTYDRCWVYDNPVSIWGIANQQPCQAELLNSYLIGRWDASRPSSSNLGSTAIADQYWAQDTGIPDEIHKYPRGLVNRISGNTFVDLFTQNNGYAAIEISLSGYKNDYRLNANGGGNIGEGNAYHPRDRCDNNTIYTRESFSSATAIYGTRHGANWPSQSLDLAKSTSLWASESQARGANAFWGETDTINYDQVYGTKTTDIGVFDNEFEPGRGRVVIANHGLDSSVIVDISSITGLNHGDEYVLRDVNDFYGPPLQTGRVSGNNITVTIDTPDSELGYFRAFEVIKTKKFIVREIQHITSQQLNSSLLTNF